MAAYLVGQVTVRDPRLWAQYAAAVGESLAPFGAEVVFRGRRGSVLAGVEAGETAVVIRFADHDTLLRWFRSDAYQALIPLRDRAAEVALAGYEELG